MLRFTMTVLLAVITSGLAGCSGGQPVTPRFFTFMVRELGPQERTDLLEIALANPDSPTVVDPQSPSVVFVRDQVILPERATQVFATQPGGVLGSTRNVDVNGSVSRGDFNITLSVSPVRGASVDVFPLPKSFTIQSPQSIALNREVSAFYTVEISEPDGTTNTFETGPYSDLTVTAADREQVAGKFQGVLTRRGDARRVLIFDGAFWLNRK